MSNINQNITVEPMDNYNRELVQNVHPLDWINPQPASRYNLVVIGGGTAGLVTAAGAAGLGAKVALVEKHLLGGDCLNVGCVPSKCIIRSSRTVAEIKSAGQFGIKLNGNIDIDFAAVMQRMRRLRSGISHHDSAIRFHELGVDVFLGEGRFTDKNAIAVYDISLPYKKAVIAAGARAVAPPIKGLQEAGYLTNETVFSLTARPPRLAVIGGGPIGSELSQAFQRLGSQVFLFEMADHILVREDADAAEIVQNNFKKEGIKLLLASRIHQVENHDGQKIIHYIVDDTKQTIEVDEILVGAGRAPNVDTMNLDAAGIKYDKFKGVIVDDQLRTSNSRVFAAGDICMNWKFTHAADAAARIVIQNALFKGHKKLSDIIMPWCTYTDPEIAHVGLYEHEAHAKGIDVETFIRQFKEVDRAIADGQIEGFVKVHVQKGTDKIIGATIVAAHAGEMLSEITLAMAAGIGLKTLSGVIHPYPTQAEAIKQIGDAYNRTRLTPFLKKAFAKWLAWTR